MSESVKLVKNTNTYFKTCYNKNYICVPINVQHEHAYESDSTISIHKAVLVKTEVF